MKYKEEFYLPIRLSVPAVMIQQLALYIDLQHVIEKLNFHNSAGYCIFSGAGNNSIVTAELVCGRRPKMPLIPTVIGLTIAQTVLKLFWPQLD